MCNLKVEGSSPSIHTTSKGVLRNSRLQASSLKVARLNTSKVARRKAVRLLALTRETLASQLDFSFSAGLIRLPVVGGLFEI